MDQICQAYFPTTYASQIDITESPEDTKRTAPGFKNIYSKNNKQFIDKALANQDFIKINGKLCHLAKNGQPILFADLEYVQLAQAENQIQNGDLDPIQEKLQALDKLNRIIYEVETLTQQLQQQRQQKMIKLANIEKQKNQREEQIDILNHQNTKLEEELKESYMPGNKSQENSQNVSPNTSEKDAKTELQAILTQYGCLTHGFPKNKTEVLMLINRIEGQIQKLELQELNSFNF